MYSFQRILYLKEFIPRSKRFLARFSQFLAISRRIPLKTRLRNLTFQFVIYIKYENGKYGKYENKYFFYGNY